LDFWFCQLFAEPVPSSLVLVLFIGAGIGFLGGLLGKGGSAIATPMLLAVGIPPAVALAAPLPATVPGALVAADRYRRQGQIDRTVLKWSLIAGVPATIIGAVATRWIDASFLVLLTEVVIVGLGLRMLLAHEPVVVEGAEAPPVRHGLIVGVAVVTGLAAGLLANSGGFLLAPLFIGVLGLSIKPALGTSLATASVLAIPGSLVHLALGHLDLRVVLVFALGSIPLSSLGAKVALRTDPGRLEKGYGAVLVLLGVVFLAGKVL
jgi:hypothetical protein